MVQQFCLWESLFWMVLCNLGNMVRRSFILFTCFVSCWYCFVSFLFRHVVGHQTEKNVENNSNFLYIYIYIDILRAIYMCHPNPRYTTYTNTVNISADPHRQHACFIWSLVSYILLKPNWSYGGMFKYSLCLTVMAITIRVMIYSFVFFSYEYPDCSGLYLYSEMIIKCNWG